MTYDQCDFIAYLVEQLLSLANCLIRSVRVEEVVKFLKYLDIFIPRMCDLEGIPAFEYGVPCITYLESK